MASQDLSDAKLLLKKEEIQALLLLKKEAKGAFDHPALTSAMDKLQAGLRYLVPPNPASRWFREVIGECPRLVYHGEHTAYVETHSETCRKASGTRRGWTLLCNSLNIRLALKAKTEDEALKEAQAILSARFAEMARDVCS